jgi:hypothetical protein
MSKSRINECVSGVRVTWFLCVYFVDLFLFFFLLAIVFSVRIRFTDSDYPLGIFKLFLKNKMPSNVKMEVISFQHSLFIYVEKQM